MTAAERSPAAAIEEHLLRTIRHGVAVAEPASLRIRFENEAFFGWFKPRGDAVETLADRLVGCPVVHGLARLREGRPFLSHLEVSDGPRKLSLAVELRLDEIAGEELLVAEVRDASKQKEAEYMLDSYSRLAERHSRDLLREKERVERLLLNLMPRPVYEELKDYGAAAPHRFAAASVLMLDFAGFTEMVAVRDPASVVGELNEIFTAFDRIVEMQGCERIKTMGDAYLAVCGVPEANPDHAVEIARAALRMRRFVERRNASHATAWHCRAGLHTGTVVGSIVGVQKYVYDIFGPAVDVAARLDALARPMEIVVSGAMAGLLQDGFVLERRGPATIEGAGPIELWALVDEVREAG